MFAANFKRGQEREAQLCVYVGERMVVDLWGSATGDKAGHSPLFFCFFLGGRWEKGGGKGGGVKGGCSGVTPH
jgi:hypothetical protein